MRVLSPSRRMALVALLAMAVLAPSARLAQGGEAVVLGCATAANLKGLFVKLGQLAEKFVPGAGAQAQGMGAMLTQAPEWAGVDWGKPATVIIFGGKAFGKDEPVPVVVASLADAAQFRQAHAAGGPMGFDIRGEFVVASPDKAALAAVTPQRLELYSKMPGIAANADLYLTIYVSLAVDEYRTELDEALKGMEDQAGGMAMPGPMASLAKMVKCVGPLVKLAGKEVRRASFIVQFNDDSLELRGRLYSAEDSTLSTFLSNQPAETTDLVKYLPADLVMSMAGKLDIAKAKPLIEAVLAAVAAPLELAAEDQDKLRSLMFASTQTGEFATGIAGGATGKGIQTLQVVEIADAAKFRTASKEGVEWFMNSGFFGAMQQMGVKVNIEYKPAAREYQGVQIDRFTVTFAQPADVPPNPMMGQMPPQVTEIAAIGTTAISVANDPDGTLMNSMIDRVKGAGTAGFDTSAACKAARAAAPKGASIVTHVSFNSMLAKFVEEVAKQQPPVAMMVGAFVKADANEEPITSHAVFGANMVEVNTRIPHQPILALVTRVRAMMQQGPPGMKGGPKPKELDDF